jgi:hypothetical protein
MQRLQHAYDDGRLEDALLNHHDADDASAAIAKLMRWVLYILPSFLYKIPGYSLQIRAAATV